MNKTTPNRSMGRHAALVLGLALSTFAHADCVDGVRQATPAERDFHQRATAALLALIPPPQPSSELRGKLPDFKALPSIADFCRGEKLGSFEVTMGASYLYKWPNAEAERRSAERRQLLDQITALEQLPPEPAARYKALTEQAREAYNSQPKAKRGGPPLSDEDRKLAEQKIAEGRAIDAQAKALLDAHLAQVAPQVQPLRAKADALQPYPQEIGVVLKLNARRFEEADPRVVRHDFGSPHRGGLAVSNVTVAFGGPEGPARQRLIDAVDLARIQAMVGAPLPAVAESEARAQALAAAPREAPAADKGSTPAARSTDTAARAPAASPTSTAARAEDAKKTEAPAVAQEAANAVNKLKSLLGR